MLGGTASTSPPMTRLQVHAQEAGARPSGLPAEPGPGPRVSGPRARRAAHPRGPAALPPWPQAGAGQDLLESLSPPPGWAQVGAGRGLCPSRHPTSASSGDPEIRKGGKEGACRRICVHTGSGALTWRSSGSTCASKGDVGLSALRTGQASRGWAHTFLCGICMLGSGPPPARLRGGSGAWVTDPSSKQEVGAGTQLRLGANQRSPLRDRRVPWEALRAPRARWNFWGCTGTPMLRRRLRCVPGRDRPAALGSVPPQRRARARAPRWM